MEAAGNPTNSDAAAKTEDEKDEDYEEEEEGHETSSCAVLCVAISRMGRRWCPDRMTRPFGEVPSLLVHDFAAMHLEASSQAREVIVHAAKKQIKKTIKVAGGSSVVRTLVKSLYPCSLQHPKH